jgi:hypothetical protein
MVGFQFMTLNQLDLDHLAIISAESQVADTGSADFPTTLNLYKPIFDFMTFRSLISCCYSLKLAHKNYLPMKEEEQWYLLGKFFF